MIRCPYCKSFYPNPIPKTKPGDAVTLKCKPSKRWRGQRPPVPEGERAEWCGRTFTLHVRPEPPAPRERVVAQAASAGAPKPKAMYQSIESPAVGGRTAAEAVAGALEAQEKDFKTFTEEQT